MTVSDLLQASRFAHLDFRAAIRDGRMHDVKLALKRALENRQEAEKLDPAHIDHAWEDDVAQTFGIIAPTPTTDKDLHTDLLAFYHRELERLG